MVRPPYISRTTHLICDICWQAKRRHSRKAGRVPDSPTARCCYCHVPTDSGIYLKDDPTFVPCEGKGGIHGA